MATPAELKALSSADPGVICRALGEVPGPVEKGSPPPGRPAGVR